MKKNKSTIILILVFFVGLSVMLYPTLSDYVNQLHQSRAVATYAEDVDKLTDAEIEAILETADQLVAWASDIKEYALQQSLQGKTWKNWKLVEGRTRRAYCSETAAAEAVQAAGFDPYEHKVLGITAMTRMLGKKKFEELLGDLLVKPQGKPTLVPLSDKRPAWNTAQVDFKE